MSAPPTSGVEAVVTTGIYCRPGCSARPNPDNTRPYPSAAAAESAGFRACLRCRPYRLDAPVTVDGPELVCRGVQLILGGALDPGGTAAPGPGEAALAARLGASARHLRRLFVEHLGVTPDRLARSRRAHFARRLLDDTDLCITEVAFAAGFGSTRQFNRTMVETFRASPRELRARRRVSDRLVADGGLCIRLPFTARPDAPFEWEAVRGYLAARAIDGVEAVDAHSYRRTVMIDGDPGVIEVVPAEATPGEPAPLEPAPLEPGRGRADHLLLRAHLPHWEGLIHVVQRVRRIFGLDVDPAPAYAALVADPVLGSLVRARPGLRVPGTWDPFEIGVRAIVGQQVSVAGANTLTARLVARHGTPVAGLAALGLTHVFPTPASLADAGLDGLGLTTRRAAAIRAFAQAVADGKLPFDRSASLTELVDAVGAVDGLGPWTAHYLALRLGEPDAFPESDLGLRRAVARISGRPCSAPALGELSEWWRPWRAHAAAYLWTDR